MPQNVSEFFEALYEERNAADLQAFVIDPFGYLQSGRLAADLSNDHKAIILGDEDTIKFAIEQETGRAPSAFIPLKIIKF
jgi:hypothetical protein